MLIMLIVTLNYPDYHVQYIMYITLYNKTGTTHVDIEQAFAKS